ncbi:MAG: protein translocase subunit SecD [Actinobacteria bacterium HGW-Actinobacteria-2]|nr:MAG: protein translocase subunit SecD [Actinobacteria bacterium HGW-Actinobacteria-2]
MATSKQQAHPLRTLIILFAVIAGLFTIMAVNASWAPKLGLDLRGGTTITLTASNTSGSGTVDPKSLELARTIIEQRVNAYGVGESEVTTAGERQIVVTAPNVQKDDLVKLVGQTAQLNFRKVYAEESTGVAPTPTTPTTPTTSPTVAASPTANRRPLPELPTPVPSPRPTAPSPTKQSLDQLLKWTPSDRDQSDFQAYTCDQPSPTPDVTDQPLISCDDQGNKLLMGPVLIPGESVSRAVPSLDNNGLGWVVNLEFNASGAADFTTVTSHLAQQTAPANQFAIVLDGTVVSAPKVEKVIAGGRAEIYGNFTQKSATDLATVLSYGALPLAFEISSVDNVSAKLGADQLQAGLIAGLIGLVLVVGYSILYYRGLAIVVTMSLAVAASLVWSLMVLLGQAIGFALNLPGIAGAIVAIGVTADSFIIYFERIRDEVRDGRGLRTAIETGWVRSRKTILAADSVSLLSAVVLYALAIGAVKGFAFTLGLTTLIDLVVVFFFTKPLMTLLGRTKFWGQGRRFSGFEAEHMGTSSAPLHNSVRKTALSGGKA